MIKAWYHVSGDKVSSILRSALQVLQKAGLETYPLNPKALSGPGLVFFSAADAGLYDFLKEVSRSGFERVLAVTLAPLLSAQSTAWNLLKAGASDLISLDLLLARPESVTARFARWQHIDEAIHSPLIKNAIVGSSFSWISVLRLIVEVAQFTDADVLLEGETGTGKEVLARLLHNLDPRPDKGELVVLDCTTIVPELSGSEFFGHERGAFTGAVNARNGAFALADGGTLFLDEIGCMSAAMQSKFLRVLEDKVIERLGSEKGIPVDVRIISATNIDFAKEIKAGKFRQDLFYRLNVIPLQLIPLRERKDDIPLFVQYFLDKFNKELNKKIKGLSAAALGQLTAYDWPGNVRELQNLLERLVVLADGETIEEIDLPLPGGFNAATATGGGTLKASLLEHEKAVIMKVLAENGNNRSLAAKALGLPRSTFCSRLESLGLS